MQHIISTNFQCTQKHLLNFALVIHLRHSCRALYDCLSLSKALSLTEDCRVTYWHNVHRTVKVLGLDIQTRCLRFDVFYGQVGTVDAVQDLEHTAH